MALGGSYQDLNVRAYTDMLNHELQQQQSLLMPLVEVTNVEGERTYFSKIGKVDSYIRTTRLEDAQRGEQTYERRYVTPRIIESTQVPSDPLDLARWARDPQPEVAAAMAMELNRQKDDLIVEAISGLAAREINGSLSSVGFDPTMVVAVNENQYTQYTGDTGLHHGKIIKAKTMILQKYGMNPNDVPIVVGGAADLAGLAAQAFGPNGNAAGFFRQDLPDTNKMSFDQGMGMFLGCKYISFEGLGVDASSDRNVYVVAPGALKFGIWQALQFHADPLPDKASRPIQLMANETIGCVRFFEEKIVRIMVDPTNAFATT